MSEILKTLFFGIERVGRDMMEAFGYPARSPCSLKLSSHLGVLGARACIPSATENLIKLSGQRLKRMEEAAGTTVTPTHTTLASLINLFRVDHSSLDHQKESGGKSSLQLVKYQNKLDLVLLARCKRLPRDRAGC